MFTPTVALAYAIAETFRAAGIAAEALDGTTPLATRRAILQRLHTGATHVVESVTATHCLDACTVIAYLRNEAGAEVLKALIERPTTFLAMHVCNLGEVYYDFFHIPPNYVVERVTAQRKPPEVTICRLRNQSRVGTVPPSTSTPHWPAC